MGEAAGLAALGFWLFLAAVVVAGIWFDSRKRESQQETLRRVVESGQDIDPAMVDKLLAAGAGRDRIDRELKVAGLIVIFVAPGLALLGWFLSALREELLGVMLGVALLVGFVGAGLLVAGKVSERWYREDQG
ncbi:MAG: DUF6249 domain-containing protein [Gammaproteobacteria bacterium]|nr:DUF6249 domain-containing protein [Gammaproteobacteria bacterium]